MPIINVSAKLKDGNLVLVNRATQAEICTIDAAGSLDVVALKLNGTLVTKTAAEINALPVVEQATIAAVAVADASVQGVGYVQADVESIRTLANANKAKINAILTALKAANIIADA